MGMPTRTDRSAAMLPKNFVRPCLLLLLREQSAHGYELLERLRPLGFDRDDPGRLYRALRSLESEQLVRSTWEASENGPDRRIYEITRKGMEHLHGAAAELEMTRSVVDRFLSRYSEFASLPHERASTRRVTK